MSRAAKTRETTGMLIFASLLLYVFIDWKPLAMVLGICFVMSLVGKWQQD